jgi:hypothetical protein
MNVLVHATSALIPLLLAACGGPANVAKPDNQSSASAPSTQRQPGSWNMLHYTMAFDATGVEGGMAEMVKAGQASVGKKDFGGPLCLTAERAAKDDLSARLGEAIRFGPEWKIIRSQVSTAGEVDFVATMEDPAQGKAQMTITGQITPTITDLLVTTDAWQPAPGKGYIHTVMKQENSRKGDCTPSQDTWQ